MKLSVAALTVLLLAVPALCRAAPPGFMLERMGTLTGRVVTEDGKPVASGGVVSFFDAAKGIPPLVANMHRIPDMVGTMNADGGFSAKLVPGRYYMGVLLITDPERGPGPPRPGETFYFAREAQAGLREFTLGVKEEKDAGQVIAAPPESFPLVKNLVTIEGRLVKDDGQPFAGGVVLVKTDMNQARPDFVSERTGEDGTFKLQLPPDTVYYLMGRERSVGRPVPGTYVGTYGSTASIDQGGAAPVGNQRPVMPAINMPPGEAAGSEPVKNQPATVSGQTGQTISGIEIMMFKLPNPEEQREKLQGSLGFGDEFKEQMDRAVPLDQAPAREQKKQ